jgi:hypothetical protein
VIHRAVAARVATDSTSEATSARGTSRPSRSAVAYSSAADAHPGLGRGRCEIGNHVWIGPQSYFDARDLVMEDYGLGTGREGSLLHARGTAVGRAHRADRPPDRRCASASGLTSALTPSSCPA